jgi:hypothetical protein
MKYIKKYKLFIEADEFDIQTTDTPDIKMAKEKMDTIEEQFAEYRTKKITIDQLYLNTKDDSEIEEGLQKILGKTDIQNGPDRNPFLIEYSYLAKLKRSLDKMRQQNVDDKIKLDDFNEELMEAEEQTVKESISSKIKQINERVLERVKKITQTQQDFNLKEQEHKARMLKTESDMKEYIKKISNVG